MIPAPPTPDRPIVCLGDSVTVGVRTTRGWPEHLWAAAPHRKVVNLGVAGARLIDICRRAPDVVRTWCGADGWDVCVVQVGLYDARGGSTSPREAAVLLRQTLATLARGGPVLLLGLTPVAPTATLHGFDRHARRWVARSEATYQEEAARVRVDYLSLATMPHELLADGVHPGPAGYEWIAGRVRSALGDL